MEKGYLMLISYFAWYLPWSTNSLIFIVSDGRILLYILNPFPKRGIWTIKQEGNYKVMTTNMLLNEKTLIGAEKQCSLTVIELTHTWWVTYQPGIL